ncbi:lytic transglycosylase domain-containing protein [Lolliginicoccus suaedae]|uniref:lytic transglycosylase domain-containing protein n=1 Tax=Lolliginicoccus suaedae TaxID=2605429 RepID=UPI0011EE6D23|nr:lytic murein transglycosylase [Lolliginicoccus suaedae]
MPKLPRTRSRSTQPGHNPTSILALAALLPVGLFGIAAGSDLEHADTVAEQAQATALADVAIRHAATSTNEAAVVGIVTPELRTPPPLRSARSIAVDDAARAAGIDPDEALTQLDHAIGSALENVAVNLGAFSVPAVMVDAYKRAAANMVDTRPGCGLSWTLLGGIGRVESGHASNGAVDINGRTLRPILGPRLDGTTPNTATIRDTDGGQIDGDDQFDRAIGAMQFIPSTWAMYASDGNGDGTSDPHNVYDATLAAAKYLCDAGGDLTVPANQERAILRYNQSRSYLHNVRNWATAYATGVLPTPTDLPPAGILPWELPAPGAPGSDTDESARTLAAELLAQREGEGLETDAAEEATEPEAPRTPLDDLAELLPPPPTLPCVIFCPPPGQPAPAPEQPAPAPSPEQPAPAPSGPPPIVIPGVGEIQLPF